MSKPRSSAEANAHTKLRGLRVEAHKPKTKRRVKAALSKAVRRAGKDASEAQGN